MANDNFSINDGSNIEAHKLTDINSVLQNLPDNTHKLIKPKDIRNAFLTIWSDSLFKIIDNGSSKYIGIDSGDPLNRDRKMKILLGKRKVQNYNVMNSSLLNSDTDIFFYNTKSDDVDQKSTKVSFLAGDQLSLFNKAPYMEARVKGNDRIELNIINEQSSINIKSENSTVSINGIEFPKIVDIPEEDHTLVYRNGKLEWDELKVTSFDMGNDNSTFNLIGSTVSLNGNLLEFIEDRLVPETVGGIVKGMSFSGGSFTGNTYSGNWGIIDVLRELLYPELPPKIEFVNNSIIITEKDHSTDIEYKVKVTTYPRENSEMIGTYSINDINGTHSFTFDIEDFEIFEGSFSFTPTNVGTYTFSAHAITSTGESNSDDFLTVQSILPIYYGTSSNTQSLNLTTLNKKVTTFNNYTHYYTNLSNSYIIFAYDKNDGVLNRIEQNNMFDITELFEYYYDGNHIVYNSIDAITVSNGGLNIKFSK